MCVACGDNIPSQIVNNEGIIKSMPQSSASTQPLSMQSLRELYLCPAEFIDFRLDGRLSRNAGYFQFGPGATCYGRTVNNLHRTRASGPLVDALPDVSLDGTTVTLPFDPDEVIDNLRLERFPEAQWGKGEKTMKDLYYRLRPLTTRLLRKGVQRLRAANGKKRQFPKWPLDTSVESIFERLMLLSLWAHRIDRIPFIWFWPDGARACVTMTHDVETAAGRDFCPQLLDIDDSFGFKASYQVVPEGRYAVASGFLNGLRDRRCEVCVQDLNHDGRLFDEHTEFLSRAASINRYGRQFRARGFRSAVLYRNPEWFHHLDFSFDMSIPNVAHLDPQRGGCCTVMPYFIGKLLELPLTTIQDYSLFHVRGDLSIRLWRTQVEAILAKNGLASFIVHPDYIVEPETQAVYKSLLAMLSQLRRQNAIWMALPSEIDHWWRARSRMSIVEENGSWRIVGEGSERAVLAFAREVDGRLVCLPADAQQPEQLLCQTS